MRAYARDCIEATFRAIDTEPMVRDAWCYRVMVEDGDEAEQLREMLEAIDRAQDPHRHDEELL